MRNEENLTYINIMLDSLKEKESLLLKLREETLKQQDILEKEEFDPDAFEKTIDEKQKHIDALERLDDGFLDMYSKVKEALSKDGAEYADEVKRAKEYIKRQTELSVELQSLEGKNRNKLAIQLSQGRQKVRDYRTSSKTAAAYYKNMTNHHQDGDSYFLDRKK
jgi:predicted outer membrane protein